ncbi:unnamed protein product [Rhizophagus irregularis]|nr:unnamed protein product [Rhizophagus irregularis]
MIRKERKKGPVWVHFKTVVESNNSHPPVQCKYCYKNYQRAVPERMQAHLDKCPKAPSNAKSQPKQQLINNFNGGHMSEDQDANTILSSQHFIQRPQSPFESQDSEEMNMQIEYSDQLESPRNLHHLDVINME